MKKYTLLLLGLLTVSAVQPRKAPWTSPSASQWTAPGSTAQTVLGLSLSFILANKTIPQFFGDYSKIDKALSGLTIPVVISLLRGLPGGENGYKELQKWSVIGTILGVGYSWFNKIRTEDAVEKALKEKEENRQNKWRS